MDFEMKLVESNWIWKT